MNAITPAKLIPPDQSTAARGTLPTEQTKLSTAMSGPTSDVLDRRGPARRVCEEERVEEVVAEQADEAGEQEADRDLLPEHLPVAAEVVRDIGPGRERGQPLAPAQPLDAAVWCWWPASAALRVRARLLLQSRRDERRAAAAT